jgi:hypothetical protein
MTHIRIVSLCLALSVGVVAARAQTAAPASGTAPAMQKGAIVTSRATGTFEVKLNPLAVYDDSEGSPFGRMSIDKQFHGDLEATSKGEMLSVSTSVKNSAGYVAIERVTGTLQGRTGGFILQHSATMDRGVPNLTITVVPDSGTGQLAGLTGKFNIIMAPGKHSYEFEYSLAPATATP